MKKLLTLSLVLMMVTLPVMASEPLQFAETWGYVSMSRAGEYDDSVPLTDVLYFAADVNCYGELISVPKITTLKVTGKRRHLVFICDSKSLTHFVLNPRYDVRESIISQLVTAVQPFDGLNIDMEQVPARDGEDFLSFVQELRQRLPDKILSVCVPARTRAVADDVYPYDRLAAICDRVFIMAYDLSWSGSDPGPIASVDWGNRIASYAKKKIPAEKIVMGIPFYGRTWASEPTAQAWYYSGAMRIMKEHGETVYTYTGDIPHFVYDATVHVTGWFNDAHSVGKLAETYREAGISKVGFWRIGQEDPAVWNLLQVE